MNSKVGSKREYKEKSKSYNNFIDRIKLENKHVKIIDAEKYFCDNKSCSMIADSKLLFRDNNHLNIEGSRFLGKKIIDDYFKK